MDSSTANALFDANQTFLIVVDSSTHIAIAIGNSAGVFQIGWWQSSKMHVALSRLLFCIVFTQMAPAQIRRAA
jgi:hypothetical protein